MVTKVTCFILRMWRDEVSYLHGPFRECNTHLDLGQEQQKWY